MIAVRVAIVVGLRRRAARPHARARARARRWRSRCGCGHQGGRHPPSSSSGSTAAILNVFVRAAVAPSRSRVLWSCPFSPPLVTSQICLGRPIAPDRVQTRLSCSLSRTRTSSKQSLFDDDDAQILILVWSQCTYMANEVQHHHYRYCILPLRDLQTGNMRRPVFVRHRAHC